MPERIRLRPLDAIVAGTFEHLSEVHHRAWHLTVHVEGERLDLEADAIRVVGKVAIGDRVAVLVLPDGTLLLRRATA